MSNNRDPLTQFSIGTTDESIAIAQSLAVGFCEHARDDTRVMLNADLAELIEPVRAALAEAENRDGTFALETIAGVIMVLLQTIEALSMFLAVSPSPEFDGDLEELRALMNDPTTRREQVDAILDHFKDFVPSTPPELR